MRSILAIGLIVRILHATTEYVLADKTILTTPDAASARLLIVGVAILLGVAVTDTIIDWVIDQEGEEETDER